MLYTSLAQIQSFGPCVSGWKKVYRAFHGTNPDSDFPISFCLGSNSIDDVLWLLGKLGRKDICIEFAQWCADSCKQLKSNSKADAAYAAAAATATAAAATATADAAYAAAAAYAADAAVYAAAAAADAAYAAYAADAARKKQIQKLAELLDAAI